MILRCLSIILMLSLFVMLTPDKIHAQDNNLLNMIEVRSEDGWTNEVNTMVANLNRVDARIHRHTNANGVRIILMDVPLTDLPEFAHLSGSVPSGWSETGLTWDEVPGAGGQTVAARIGYSQPGNSHSVINLELHEYAHAVDDFVAGYKLSNSEEFRQIHSREQNLLFYDHAVPNYFNMASEYFAEAFALYYYGESSRNRLATRAPETYQFISQIHNKLLSVDSTTGNSVTLSFTPLSDATTYNVYRNDELVGEVPASEGGFTDTGLELSTTYGYFVRAVDANGTEIMTSYSTSATTGAEPDPETTEEEVVEEEVVEEVVEESNDEPVEENEEVIEETTEEETVVEETPEQPEVEEETVEESTTDEIPEFEEVTVVEEEQETEESVDTEELEDETVETETQQDQSRNDDGYPVWVYILSGILGTIVTFGVLYILSRRMN